tara:strand:- start:667 stop:987 length:321 start_codon:yes stop_codon:yes gene_type:complete
MSSDIRPISLRIVAVQATIDDRHYAVVYIGDDVYGKNHFRTYLNGAPVSNIVWDPRQKKFSEPKFTVVSRNKSLSKSFIWPNEVQKKMLRKLENASTLFRLVKISD